MIFVSGKLSRRTEARAQRESPQLSVDSFGWDSKLSFLSFYRFHLVGGEVGKDGEEKSCERKREEKTKVSRPGKGERGGGGFGGRKGKQRQQDSNL